MVEHHRAAEMEEDATVAALTKNLRLCVRCNFSLKEENLIRFSMIVLKSKYLFWLNNCAQWFSSPANPTIEEVERGFRPYFVGKVCHILYNFVCHT